MMSFKDYFSRQAPEYQRYRPTYPAGLFQHLAATSRTRRCAWDCATGNGQAALGLASHFQTVVATDASDSQVAHAASDGRIHYAVTTAENAAIRARSIDLVTVAQALHWFDLERFYGEVRRVLKPGGLLAVWSYNTIEMPGEPGIVLRRLYHDVVGAYWPRERRHVEDGYRSLPFPFEELASPPFAMESTWTLDRLVGYIGTWSSTQRYKEERGTDPVGIIAGDLRHAWGALESEKNVRWPLALRVGRV